LLPLSIKFKNGGAGSATLFKTQLILLLIKKPMIMEKELQTALLHGQKKIIISKAGE
jgi:hypothetical protein